MGALGAALGTMVANLSSHKAGWDERWEEFSDWADRGQKLQDGLLHLVDEDTEAFNRIMAVFAMPKNTGEEKAARSAALQEATPVRHPGAPEDHESRRRSLPRREGDGRDRQP